MCIYIHVQILYTTFTCLITVTLGGQKQAQRISKLLRTCKQKLTKLLAQYSQLQRESGEDIQFSIEDICNLESHFWVVSDHAYASSNHSTSIPPASQRRLIELCHLCR